MQLTLCLPCLLASIYGLSIIVLAYLFPQVSDYFDYERMSYHNTLQTIFIFAKS